MYRDPDMLRSGLALWTHSVIVISGSSSSSSSLFFLWCGFHSQSHCVIQDGFQSSGHPACTPANRKRKVERGERKLQKVPPPAGRSVYATLLAPHIILHLHAIGPIWVTQHERPENININMAPNNIMCLPPREKRRTDVGWTSSLGCRWAVISSSRRA